MDVIYRSGRASVGEVHEGVPDRPSYSAVGTLLGILEQKGHLKHERVGNKYVYMPTRSRKAVQRSAVKRLLETFFNDSTEEAVAALQARGTPPTQEELERLAELINKAGKEGR